MNDRRLARKNETQQLRREAQKKAKLADEKAFIKALKLLMPTLRMPPAGAAPRRRETLAMSCSVTTDGP